eukprot:GDKH01026807.1.p2 GENE.GDKH01026807.1~~GDKH01026807.1.p2  ORF type:complete len:50 (+),score=6.69 GDKH01026807.1:130-279(+)
MGYASGAWGEVVLHAMKVYHRRFVVAIVGWGVFVKPSLLTYMKKIFGDK